MFVSDEFASLLFERYDDGFKESMHNLTVVVVIMTLVVLAVTVDDEDDDG